MFNNIILTGAEAVEATNVFYYLTYPGSVSWSAIKDPVQLQVNDWLKQKHGHAKDDLCRLYNSKSSSLDRPQLNC